MKKSFFYAAAVAAVMAGCSSQNNNSNYKLTTTVDAEQNGSRAYIINYDSGEPVDSTDVTDGTITFSGSVEKPIMARLIIGGNRGPLFVLEPGEITIDPESGDAKGTTLNDALNGMATRQEAIISRYQALPDDSASQVLGQQLQQQYDALTDSMMKANAGNPVGYYLFMQRAYDMSLAQLNEAVSADPSLGEYQRVIKLRDALAKKEETSVGNQFKDFEITYNGETKKLSEYVGKGHYTLVDFWASWCGPCIRETATIKELYNKYGEKGLDVLGVAVWDEPDNTKAAIESHQLPWPQIINAQTIPTDLYGISSIPTIILFDPQGKIVSRGKQGAELIADVDAAMSSDNAGAETK